MSPAEITPAPASAPLSVEARSGFVAELEERAAELRALVGPSEAHALGVLVAEMRAGARLPELRWALRSMATGSTQTLARSAPEPAEEWTEEDERARVSERARRAAAKRRHAELTQKPGNVRNESGLRAAPPDLALTEDALSLFRLLVGKADAAAQIRASELASDARRELERVGVLRTERVRGHLFFFLTVPVERA